MKYQVTAKLKDGRIVTKVLSLPANSEAAEAECECYFENLYTIEDMKRLG